MIDQQSVPALPGTPDEQDDTARKQRIKALFTRYPDITSEERRELTDYLKSGPLLEIGLLKGDETIRYKIAAFEQEQAKALSHAPKEIAVLLVIFVLLAVACSALWDMGA
ncbi:hypothetical protein [Blastomonas fulva]|uniref:hypothetical protein n=1 Tax=Blastomonas fulva TaxID=1550728 RepID=UPI0025A3EF60|nr:hypothetical protein [Blastomonas fulva]MDM7967047.1 hypothetical protein [Blastomonas fulva]